jgi:uncharacterized delta-60 repeat protein
MRFLRPLLCAVLLAVLPSLRAQPIDAAFAPSLDAEVFALAAQSDGKILVAGNFTTIGSVARIRLARLNSDGSLDGSFTPSPNTTSSCLALQPDGKILVGGDFTAVNGLVRARLARLNADGSLDPTFTNGADASVRAIVLQPDGKILVGGYFVQFAGTARTSLVRLNADGSLDAAFSPVITGTLFPTSATFIEAIAVQPDGKIFVGGNFTTVAGQTRNSLARLNADGSLDATFTLNANSDVQTIVFQSDGKMLVAGSFSQLGGINRAHVVRLLSNGTVDPAFTTSGTDSAVQQVGVQTDGKILLSGNFNLVGSVTRRRLARLNIDGSLDLTFDPDVTGALGLSTPSVYALIAPEAGQVVFGGAFTTVSGQTHNGLARLGNPPVLSLQPTDITASAGAGLTLTVAATGTNLRYQWRRNGTALAGATTATLSLPDFQIADTGSYTVAVSSVIGTTVSPAANLVLAAPIDTRSLAITVTPQSEHALAGTRVTLVSAAVGSAVTFQWKKDGAALPGATAANYTLPSVFTGDMGYYSVVVSSGGSSIESRAAILTVAVPGVEGRLINVSTRGFVPAGGSLTPGFVIAGNGNKRLLIRAIGPTLLRFGVNGIIPDPRLDVVPLGSVTALAANDDWVAGAALTAATNATGAFTLDPASRDSALLTDLAANGSGYTARITTASATTSGLVLAEVYDTEITNSPARLSNVSTRGFVGTGANALVPGFVIGGGGPKQLLIRAVGPGLAPFGVTGLLADPQLSVIPLGKTASVASNDNWGGTTALSAAFAAVGAFALPTDSKDAAVLVRLPPGAYTVTVSGVGDTTGTALVEIYDVP